MIQINLKKLREHKGISQYRLAEMMGVSQSTVGMWESGKNKPEHQNLEKLCKIFDVSMGTLLDSDFGDVRPDNWIPVLGRVAAGIPIEAVEDIVDYEELSPEMAAKGEHFALKIKGDSMTPRIHDGDVVIVKKQETCDSGDIAIVMANGTDAACKRVKWHKDGMSLIAFNSAYPPVFHSKDDIENLPVSIIGKVVELRGKF